MGHGASLSTYRCRRPVGDSTGTSTVGSTGGRCYRGNCAIRTWRQAAKNLAGAQNYAERSLRRRAASWSPGAHGPGDDETASRPPYALHEPVFYREAGRGRPGGDPELGVGGAEVLADGAGADEEALGDGRVGHAFGDQPEDVKLA